MKKHIISKERLNGPLRYSRTNGILVAVPVCSFRNRYDEENRVSPDTVNDRSLLAMQRPAWS